MLLMLLLRLVEKESLIDKMGKKNGILKCPDCSTYSLFIKCKKCESSCVSPKPAKFNVDDKYGSYRRVAKEALFKEDGLL